MTEPRSDAWEKVTGRARYAVDAAMPNMAHAAVVRSERAHAHIAGIDRAEAEAAPGVIAVVTAGDLGHLGLRFGHIVPDHCILAVDKVRYYGEPVAVVVAETPHQAADAAELVWVDYEDLPALTDAAAALASDVLIHEQFYASDGEKFLDVAPAASVDNAAHRGELAWGDAEAALSGADTVVETTTTFPLVYGYAMETYNALADWQPGSLHVVSTAQHPLMVRRELARMFSLPLSAVRVEVPYIGGGYGSKSYTKLEPLAAAASWAAGRPVKVTTDVEGAMYTTRVDGALVTVRTGFDSGARIVARDIDIRFDTGAYADNSPLVLTKSINRSFGPYRMPNLRVRGVAAYTNTSPASSYRGFGAPQAALAGELNMDMAADRLGIDPVELRRRNLLSPGDTIIDGKRPLDADLVADLDAVAAALEQHAGEPVPGILRGRAVAVTASDAGASPNSTTQVRMHADGSVTLLVSSTEMGQGSRTALAQIAARELGVPIEAVAVGQSDTRFTPFEWTTGASRTTTIVGLAVQAACDDLWDNLRDRAAESAGVPVDAVTASDGLIHVPLAARGEGGSGAGPDTVSGLTPSEVIRQWFGADAGEVVGVGVVRRAGATEVLPPFWEIGAIGVEVSVDEATGEVTVEHLVTVGDVGHAVNPDLVAGQDLGAATQGLGIALWEEMVYDGEQLTNPNLVEYRVPRLRDTPRRITSVLAERGDGAGPYGAKGAGEGALNPVPAAVAAAVGRAVGVWPTELPLTPPRVWSLLQQAVGDG
ncbi:MAG: xanthine dehydrogenase family protein molybdopterin-binding subunit [Acidimicrobiaceae bacterium]|nr:xanthine dehydrogenase family protein molybdopterin-binding subunit [Acidimicrobiaceae bacterium]